MIGTANEYRVGDINNDGVIDTTDSQLVMKYALGSATPSVLQREAADVNMDGQVDTTDARLILQKASGNLLPLAPR